MDIFLLVCTYHNEYANKHKEHADLRQHCREDFIGSVVGGAVLVFIHVARKRKKKRKKNARKRSPAHFGDVDHHHEWSEGRGQLVWRE